MTIIKFTGQRCVYLCGLEPTEYDQVRLDIMAAQECDCELLRELAIELHVGVLLMHSQPILVIGIADIPLLMAITRLTGGDVLHDIIQGLDSVREMSTF